MTTKELTEGNPLKLIILFMIPMLFGNIFQQLYNFFDALIVGRKIGLSALASIGATTPVIFLVISFIFASTQGFSVVTAQKFGNREYDSVKKSAAASFILSAALTVVITLLFTPNVYSILSFLKTPSDIIKEAEQYLFIMCLGIFATVFYNVASNLIRALGDSKTPLYFLIFSSFLNIFMDLLFIVKFKWGVQGAGVATVIAQGISTIFCLIYMYLKFPLLRLKKEDFVIDKIFLYEHLRIGIPMGFQMSVLSLGIIAVQYVLNGLGAVAIAAFTTAVRVDQLVSQSMLSLGASIATYTAQNFGANKLDRIRQGAHYGILIAFIISIFCITVLTLFGENIISLFLDVKNLEVIRLAKQYLNIIMIFFFFFGLLLIYRNILQGMGSVVVPLLSGIAELIMRIVAAFILGKSLGYLGICYATPLAWILGAIVLYAGYKINLVKHNINKL